MKISVIYPICGVPPSDPNAMPHSFLLESLDSILAAGDQDFEVLVGIDGDRPWVLAFLRYWVARHRIKPEQMKIIPMTFTGTFGNSQRNQLMKLATGDYITFLDHDDAYNPGAFDAIDNIARQAPGRPIFFKMSVYQFQSSEMPRSEPFTLWRQETLGHVVQAMVGGHMFVVPNRQELLSIWPITIYEADFHFIKSTVDNFREHGIEPVWADFVIAEVRPWARWWGIQP